MFSLKALQNARILRLDWIAHIKLIDEDDMILIFGAVDLNRGFTNDEFIVELQRAKKRSMMLLEVWRYRSRLVPVWMQLARKGNLSDDTLNIIGSFLTEYISNKKHPLPRIHYRVLSVK